MDYKMILEELNDVLEGGDVALDFEHMASAATTLRILSDIVGNALRGIDAIDKLQQILEGVFE